MKKFRLMTLLSLVLLTGTSKPTACANPLQMVAGSVLVAGLSTVAVGSGIVAAKSRSLFYEIVDDKKNPKSPKALELLMLPWSIATLTMYLASSIVCGVTGTAAATGAYYLYQNA